MNEEIYTVGSWSAATLSAGKAGTRLVKTISSIKSGGLYNPGTYLNLFSCGFSALSAVSHTVSIIANGKINKLSGSMYIIGVATSSVADYIEKNISFTGILL